MPSLTTPIGCFASPAAQQHSSDRQRSSPLPLQPMRPGGFLHEE